MPKDKKSTRKDAKSKARTQRSGKRLVKAAKRQASKAGKNFTASGGRKYARGTTAAQTSANYEKEGKSRIKTGQKTAKKRDLKVTPRSEDRIRREQERGYNKRKRL